MGLGTIAEPEPRAGTGGRSLAPLATWPILAVASAVTALLLAVAGRYGYHRDELYFLAAGHHLAWGYPDQPPFAPLLARAMSAVAPGSVAVLRVPSALAAGAVVLLSGLSARELGAGRTAQVLAASIMATGGVLYGVGHLLSTATFYVLDSAALLWLVARALRSGNERLWLTIGLVAGLGVMDDDLVAFVMAAVVFGLLVVGPRDVLRSPWLWAGGVLALAMWSPYLVWQASHGWPELAVSRSIAAGNSGSSTPRPLLIPEQLVLLNPWLSPVWVAGLVRLVRDRTVRWCRSIGIGWLFLVVVFLVTGGKSYYLAGTFPILLGAGAQPSVDWIRRRDPAGRWRSVGIGMGIGAVGAVLVTVPVLPIGILHDTPIVAANYDMGETVAWSNYIAEIAAVYRRVAPGERSSMVILTNNYGEAGAVDRYGGADGLPVAYSVQNGFWYWGPPPATDTHVVAVGFHRADVDRFCSAPSLATRLANPWKVHNQEEGAPVWVCNTLRGTWARLWPQMRIIG
ncbi:MAG TPA: glycosyltransferase family 39 protein [Acidimicrobiales bacterium]|nr:glycosyltransferase family 39 protein [Acidimicrobiales bacterium]